MKYCASMLFALVVVSNISCVSYRYFPVHQQFYNFDSAHDYRLSVDADLGPFTLSAITGANVDVAYSPVKHVAVCAHGYGYKTTGQDRSEALNHNTDNFYTLNSHSNAYGGGCGVGGYTMLDKHNGVDLFAIYDFQRVSYGFELTKRYANNIVFYNYDVDFKKSFHTVTFQPTVYHRWNDAYIDLGVGIATVLTTPPHYYDNAPLIGPFVADVMMQPGFALHVPFAIMGFNLNYSIYHPSRTPMLGDVTSSLRSGIRSHYQVPYYINTRLVLSNEAFQMVRSNSKKRKATAR